MRSVAGMSLRGTESAILVLVTPHMEPIVLVSGLSTMSTRSCAASSPISPFSRMSAVMITCEIASRCHQVPSGAIRCHQVSSGEHQVSIR
eukprot:6629211-Prymnesium_polylepis.1